LGRFINTVATASARLGSFSSVLQQLAQLHP
jgi:hypothetical protein